MALQKIRTLQSAPHHITCRLIVPEASASPAPTPSSEGCDRIVPRHDEIVGDMGIFRHLIGTRSVLRLQSFCLRLSMSLIREWASDVLNITGIV
jgi:hypothetical protein